VFSTPKTVLPGKPDSHPQDGQGSHQAAKGSQAQEKGPNPPQLSGSQGKGEGFVIQEVASKEDAGQTHSGAQKKAQTQKRKRFLEERAFSLWGTRKGRKAKQATHEKQERNEEKVERAVIHQDRKGQTGHPGFPEALFQITGGDVEEGRGESVSPQRKAREGGGHGGTDGQNSR